MKRFAELDPCLNGGTCVPTFGSYFCECPEKYYGQTCGVKRIPSETGDVVVGPRVWYQVNRKRGLLTEEDQEIHLSVEYPGDGMAVQVRFGDGRQVDFKATDFRLTNEKQLCMSLYRKYPRPSDPHVCETLPDKVVYGVTIVVGFFNDLKPRTPFELFSSDFHPSTLFLNGKKVTEGRLDDIHITILNRRIITFSQYYRIHSAIPLFTRCVYTFTFSGCSRNRLTPTVHEAKDTILLKALRNSTDPKGCSVGLVKDIKWRIFTKKGNSPFLTPPDRNEVFIDGRELGPGNHFIDFMMLVQGKPPYHGHPLFTLNYGRCWIRIVKGAFKVGIRSGNSRTVSCTRPLSLRLFTHNLNYEEKDFASVWRCDKSLEVCQKQQFLGPKIFFRTLPCGIHITFKASVVHLPTGHKTYLVADLLTTVQVDTLRCGCEYNCYPAINPHSATKLRAQINRQSTYSGSYPIQWEATLGGHEWGITQFIVPGTLDTYVDIPPDTFSNLTGEERKSHQLEILLTSNSLYCTLSLELTLPTDLPDYAVSAQRMFIDEVNDLRYSILITNHPVLFNNFPLFYIFYEDPASTNSPERDVVGIIQGDNQEFGLARMEDDSYLRSALSVGVLSPELKLVVNNNSVRAPRNLLAINRTVRLIQKRAKWGYYDEVLTEMIYLSRTIASSTHQNYLHKLKLMDIMNFIAKRLPTTTSNLVVSFKLHQMLTITNRLTLIHNLTRSPFNISIYPWRLPSILVKPSEAIHFVRLYELSAETLHNVVNYYYSFASKESTTPNNRHVLKLMFDAFLRIQFAYSMRKRVLELLGADPIVQSQMGVSLGEIRESMDKITQLYLESIRFHIGFTGSLKFSEGTTTAFGSVVTAQSIHEWTKTVLNNYQPIGVSVNLPADQFDDNELLYLGVFVEILVPHAITTPVHIVLLAHETSRKVRGTIDVVFKVNGTNRKELRSKWIIPRRQEKRITIIEIQLDSEPDLNGEKFHRQVKVNFVCNVRVRAILLNHVPTYSEVEPVIPALKGDFFMVVQNLSLYIGVIPPERVESQTTIVFFLRLSQFVCTQKYTNTPWDLNSVSSSRICSIITTAIVDDQSVTCSCPGSGLIKTQSLDVRARIFIIKSPPDSRNWIERVTDSRDLNYVIIAWVIIGLLVVLFGWYRDKVTYKRELIQMLPDTFPADQYAYICGVFTGSKLWAGTTAHVGIQIMGSNAISRVHILTSNSYKVLQWCFDDWFAIFTPDNLGRLNYVKLWQDYSEACPDWYCAKIMVYDVEHQSWTIFQVERWLTISKTRDMTSFALIQGRKYIPERELCEKFSFCQHYWNEIRNTHSLLSPFTKQRRFVFSHLMRASLTGTFLMSLISTVILVDFAFLHMGIIADNCSNIIIRAIIASLIASIPYTIATFFFTRSVVKMKKTKLLDLHYLEQIKRSEEFQQPRLSISNPRRSSLSHFSARSQGEKSSTSSEDLRLEYKSSKTSTTTHKNRKHMSAKRGNQFSSNNYSISMQKWIPSSIYRPVRVGNYDLKRKGMVAHVFGCITVAGSFTANMVFIVWFISVGFPESRTGSLTAAIAVVFEFIRSSLVVLLLSYHAVYISKRCNYEVSCLDLTGLQNTAKIVNHEQFLKNRTKPYYHPLSDTEMLALYKKRQKTRFFRMLVGFSGFYVLLMLSTSFLFSVTDTSSIYRLGAFNTHAYTEPVINNLTKSTKLLKDVRTIDDIYEYAQSTLLPIKTVTHWYNNRPMQTRMLWKKKKYWFLDRNSVQFTLSTLTILRATNQSRVNISRYFQDTNLDLFKTAYGHVDTSGKYKIKYNRWQQSEMIPSHVTQDRILNNGLIGIQGIFYPSSIGDEIYVRPAASLADVKNYFEKLISRNSRAIILKCVLVHLGYTPQPLSPIGYTIIDVLFENYASGIYTGSVRANFLVGRSSKSQLKAGLVSGFCTIVIFIPILMKIVFDGFKACFGKVVYWLLLIGVVNNAVGSSALIWMYFFLRTPGVNVNDAVWVNKLARATAGFFFFNGSVVGVIVGYSEMLSKNFKIRTKVVVALFFFFVYPMLFILEIISREPRRFWQIEAPATPKVGSRFSTDFFYLVYACRFFIWPVLTGLAIVILAVASDISDQTNMDWNTASMKKNPLKRKLWAREIMTMERSKTTDLLSLNSVSQGMITDMEVPVPDPTKRLESKFNAWN